MFSSKIRTVVLGILITAGVGSFFVFKEGSFSTQQSLPKTMRVKTIYGSVTVDEPVVIEVLHSKAMQRLKKINQYGVMAFLHPHQKYTRYQHSLGVFYLLNRFGASVEEQVAGLLHDVSHTVFSHVADYIHGSVMAKQSYQDTIFSWYIENTDLLPILKKHDMMSVCLFGQEGKFKMLKDNLPNLCADRLEYNLYGGFLEGWLTKEELPEMVNHIQYKNGKWIFDDQQIARKFADVSINLSIQNWCSSHNAFIMTTFSHILKRALALDIISVDDLHFSVDEVVWKRVKSSDDSEIQDLLNRLHYYETSFKVCDKGYHDLYVKTKFRGVDPLVTTDNALTTLSVMDPSFKSFYARSKEKCTDHYIAYV